MVFWERPWVPLSPWLRSVVCQVRPRQHQLHFWTAAHGHARPSLIDGNGGGGQWGMDSEGVFALSPLCFEVTRAASENTKRNFCGGSTCSEVTTKQLRCRKLLLPCPINFSILKLHYMERNWQLISLCRLHNPVVAMSQFFPFFSQLTVSFTGKPKSLFQTVVCVTLCGFGKWHSSLTNK